MHTIFIVIMFLASFGLIGHLLFSAMSAAENFVDEKLDLNRPYRLSDQYKYPKTYQQILSEKIQNDQ